MQQHLSVGIKALPPLAEALSGFLHLVKKDLARLGVDGWLAPSLLYHLIEPRELYPKVFKFERSRSLGSTNIGEEEGTMVREGRGERIKDMRVEAKVPLPITVESVELTKGRVHSFIGPSETTVLQVYLV
jgi:hypothetical protein